MVPSRPSSVLRRSTSSWLTAVAAAALLAACGGGGGGGGGPSFANPQVAPANALWGTPAAEFRVQGGRNLGQNDFTATLGGVPCTSATVSGAEVLVVCDIPRGGPSHSLDLELWHDGASVTGPLSIIMGWPPAGGEVTFSRDSEIATSATWWQEDAIIEISRGQNLPGHLINAAFGGIPCSKVEVSSEDPTVLVLTCDTPPGGAGSVADLHIWEGSSSVWVFEVTLDTCSEPAVPAGVVTLPQLCNADPGSLAAVDPEGVGGVWSSEDGWILVAPPLYSPSYSSGEFFASVPDSETFASGVFDVDGSPAWGDGILTIDGRTLSYGFTNDLSDPGKLVPFTSFQAGLGSSLTFDTYSRANAMAVDQDSVTGVWGEATSAITLTVLEDRTYYGTTAGTDYGTCQIEGTLIHDGGSRNVFHMLLAASGSSCKLNKTQPYEGLAAIEVGNTGTADAPVYEYGLIFVLAIGGDFYVSGAALAR